MEYLYIVIISIKFSISSVFYVLYSLCELTSTAVVMFHFLGLNWIDWLILDKSQINVQSP